MKKNKIIPLDKVFKRAGVVFCPTCNRGYLITEEQEFIDYAGECLTCDRLRGDKSKADDYYQDSQAWVDFKNDNAELWQPFIN
jgi:hypothetical protein